MNRSSSMLSTVYQRRALWTVSTQNSFENKWHQWSLCTVYHNRSFKPSYLALAFPWFFPLIPFQWFAMEHRTPAFQQKHHRVTWLLFSCVILTQQILLSSAHAADSKRLFLSCVHGFNHLLAIGHGGDFASTNWKWNGKSHAQFSRSCEGTILCVLF